MIRPEKAGAGIGQSDRCQGVPRELTDLPRVEWSSKERGNKTIKPFQFYNITESLLCQDLLDLGLYTSSAGSATPCGGQECYSCPILWVRVTRGFQNGD